MNEELAALTAGCEEYRDASVRQVNGGFVINANKRFMKDGVAKYAQQSESVAASSDTAGAIVAAFLANGAFPA